MIFEKEKVYDLYSAELNRFKRVRVYLPKGMKKGERYSVLYMHDGQNIVRKSQWSKHSWKVTKTLRKLNKKIIVVGLDSADPYRSEEYYAYKIDMPVGEEVIHVEPKADLYLGFLIGYLKPMIDYLYPTLSDQEHTYLAGSSLGGFITAYAALKCQGTFGAFGVFSPAFGFPGPEVFIESFEELGSDPKAKYFLACGDSETIEQEGIDSKEFFPEQLETYKGLLQDASCKLEAAKVYKGHRHSEECWAIQFRDFARLLA